jgi:hypothetical protein
MLTCVCAYPTLSPLAAGFSQNGITGEISTGFPMAFEHVYVSSQHVAVVVMITIVLKAGSTIELDGVQQCGLRQLHPSKVLLVDV